MTRGARRVVRAHRTIRRSRAVRFGGRIVRQSVWSKKPVSPEDQRIAGLLRFGYPWADVALILFGIGGMLYGIPALRDVFSPWYAQSWSGVLALVSAMCLVGVSFPTKFWRVEMGAKALLVMMLAVYGVALMAAGVLADPDDFGRSAVGFMPVALIGPLGWRVFDIPREARKRARRLRQQQSEGQGV